MDRYKSQRFGKIPLEHQRQDIRWLAIVTEGYGEPGVGIELYEDLSEGHKYDEWRENLERALMYIEASYGIKESDLMSADKVRALGFNLYGDE